MADTRPTPIGLQRALYLAFLVIAHPARMADEELADRQLRSTMGPPPPSEPAAFVVRRALGLAFLLVFPSVIAGYLFGLASRSAFGPPSVTMVTIAQIVGASLLLWGTLFVQGWPIQTFSGVTLVERDDRRVKHELHDLGVTGGAGAYLLVRRVGALAASVAAHGLLHAAQLPERGIETPETAAAERREFRRFGSPPFSLKLSEQELMQKR